jgi:hypothetical protein
VPCLGSISQEAHENLATMNRIGKSNSEKVEKILNVSKRIKWRFKK